MIANSSYDIAKKADLLGDILFLDGISRSGKKMSCRLLAQFDGIEQFNYISGIENVCYLHFLGQINSHNTSRFIHLNIDEASYDRIIGRRLNTRPTDESSIYNTTNPAEYMRRSTASDGTGAVQAFRSSGRIQLFHTHSILPFIDLLFAAFPKGRLIHVTRNPINIAHDWLLRGWGERWSNDPINFSVAAEYGDTNIPWFSVDWAEDYINMSPSERCIRSVIYLQELEKTALAGLNSDQQQRIMQYRLEDLLVTPESVVKRIANFTGRAPSSAMDAFLVSEKLPNPHLLLHLDSNMKALAKTADQALVQQLLDASANYESKEPKLK